MKLDADAQRARRFVVVALLALAASACDSRTPEPEAEPAPAAEDTQQVFWERLTTLCGRAFEGVVAVDEGGGAGPDPFEGKSLVMHVRDCSQGEIRAPFHVGDDRSRTWVFTRTDAGLLRLKHDHRHEDGSADAVTMYGGDTIDSGDATEQRFPADAESKDMFVREGLEISVPNTWIVSITQDERFSYALVRPGREFRVDFDLTRPIELPPAPWGE